MRSDQKIHAARLLVFVTVIATHAAVPAFGQTTADRSAPPAAMTQASPTRSRAHTHRSLEIEIHGGIGASRLGSKGVGTLPAAGPTFATTAGIPTRSVSSWYFGDGANLFNAAYASIGGAAPSGKISPLDTALTTSATSRKAGGSAGITVAYSLNDRIAVEGDVDVVRSPLTIAPDALSTVMYSRSSLQTAFATTLGGATVTSTSA